MISSAIDTHSCYTKENIASQAQRVSKQAQSDSGQQNLAVLV